MTHIVNQNWGKCSGMNREEKNQQQPYYKARIPANSLSKAYKAIFYLAAGLKE